MKKFFIKTVQFCLNKVISCFDYSYCLQCKNIVLEDRIEYYKDSGVDYNKGWTLSNKRECPLCTRRLEEREKIIEKVLEKEKS